MLSNMLGVKKTLLCVSGLMVAAGGPVTMFSSSDYINGVKQKWFTSSTAGPQSPETALAAKPEAAPGLSIPAPVTSSSPSVLSAMPMPSLAEVLRFDVTVEWVLQRWPRVSTGLPHLQLQGYRVPLVTGGSVADVAGSLTYFFNAQQQLQRITFRGTTGDPQILVGLLTSQHRFARRLTNDPGIVCYEAVDAGGRSVGMLKIRSAQVIRSDRPLSRFEIDLVMDRPE